MLGEQQDDLVLMEKDLRIILAADPNNAAALNALGYTLADRTTRYAEAMELVSRALELQPNEPAILDSMGWVLFRTGRYDESVQYLSRAYGNFPDPEVAAHLGEVLWVKGDKDGAMDVWQGALLRDPGHPILLDTLDRLGIDRAGRRTTQGFSSERANPKMLKCRHLTLYLLLLLVAGCAGLGQREPTSAGWQAHSQQLAMLQRWTASGKLAVRTADAAESAGLVWQQHDQDTHLQLSGPLGVGATTIYSDGQRLDIRQGDELPYAGHLHA